MSSSVKTTEVMESVDFVDVINNALNDVYMARARINWTPWKPDLLASLMRYLSAVESLHNLVAPVLNVNLDNELEKARRLLDNERYRDSIRVIDSVVRDLVGKLRDAGMLFKTGSVNVGVIQARPGGGVASLKPDKEGMED